MTQEEFEKATPEEWAAEVERCKDPVYFYNTYWVKPDGTKPKQITKQEWEGLMEAANNERYKRRTPRLNYPLLSDDCFDIQGEIIKANMIPGFKGSYKSLTTNEAKDLFNKFVKEHNKLPKF